MRQSKTIAYIIVFDVIFKAYNIPNDKGGLYVVQYCLK